MANKEKNFVSAVVYLHNCEDTVKGFMQALTDTLSNGFEHAEIICVNDACTDDSVAIVKEISDNTPGVNISLINMSYFHGLEASMNAGIDLSIGDFIFEFDSTVMDYREELVMEVYRKSLEGYDIVNAVPDKNQKLSSTIFYKVFDMFSDTKYLMTTQRFRIISRRVLNRILGMNITTPYRKVVYAGSGLRVESIVYDAAAVKEKNDKKQRRFRRYLATSSLVLFTDIGYKISGFMTVVMMLLAAFFAIYGVVIYLTGSPVEGWTTTTLFLSVAFFGLFAILTVIVKYLQIIVDLTFRRKHYSFESIQKLTK